jgi:hypothetical protein
MITVPLYLFITQWILLLVLALLVIAVYRQLGNYLGAGPKAPAGLEPGTAAPPFEYRPFGSAGAVRQFDPVRDAPALLVFADPSCQTCEEVADYLAESPHPSLHTVVVTPEPAPIIAASPSFMALPGPIGMVERDVVRRYHVDATPFLFAIGVGGTVTAAGPATTPDEVRAIAATAGNGGLPPNRPASDLIPIQSTSSKGDQP